MTTPSPINLIEHCDQLANACDTLLDDCECADANLDRVTQLARQLEIQTLYLYEAQAKLQLEREAVSRLLFWSQLRPAAIQARIVQAFTGNRRRSD
jgi:hypothetical protein